MGGKKKKKKRNTKASNKYNFYQRRLDPSSKGDNDGERWIFTSYVNPFILRFVRSQIVSLFPFTPFFLFEKFLCQANLELIADLI